MNTRPGTLRTRALLASAASALAVASILYAADSRPVAPSSPDRGDSAAWRVFTTPELPPEAPFVSSPASLGMPSLACGPHSRFCEGWARATAEGR